MFCFQSYTEFCLLCLSPKPHEGVASADKRKWAVSHARPSPASGHFTTACQTTSNDRPQIMFTPDNVSSALHMLTYMIYLLSGPACNGLHHCARRQPFEPQKTDQITEHGASERLLVSFQSLSFCRKQMQPTYTRSRAISKDSVFSKSVDFLYRPNPRLALDGTEPAPCPYWKLHV